MLSYAVVAAFVAAVSADCGQLGGNWYCNQVDTIQYTNFEQSGQYNRITSMNGQTGVCTSEPFQYSGSLAPLDGEISIHLRGPAHLKSFAAYTTGAGKKKAKRTVSRRHAHGHAEFHAKKTVQIEEKRDVGDWVTATINGQVQSWVNNWGGSPTPAAQPDDPVGGAGDIWVTATINGDVVSWLWASAPTPVAAPVDNGASPAEPTPETQPDTDNVDVANGNDPKPQGDQSASYDGDWVRSGYYEASSGTSQGLTFLNHMGGQGSGVFDYQFGNSLSFASPDAKSGSATSQVLADSPLGSNNEIAIMTDTVCTEATCGYSRPGTVAMRGFDGRHKVFLFELSMPYDGNRGFNGDMPALWALNAQIPRTLQYGKQECSCWSNGGKCGEFDILEVLDSGNHRTKSTLHAGISGGDSDWILRPADAPIKVALVMSDAKATIKVLDSSFDFSTTLSNSQIDSIVGGFEGLREATGISLFQLGA